MDHNIAYRMLHTLYRSLYAYFVQEFNNLFKIVQGYIQHVGPLPLWHFYITGSPLKWHQKFCGTPYAGFDYAGS